MKKTAANDKLIQVLSIAIPVAVALLIGIQTRIPLGSWTKVIPHIIGLLNTTTALTLVLGYGAVKRKNIELHRKMMGISFLQGSVFLVLYILYHISNPSTAFGGEGIIRPIYYFLLLSHILLSVVVVRFVLLAIYNALAGDIPAHKKFVKWAFPIWLYVSISGVLVYLLISPYYA